MWWFVGPTGHHRSVVRLFSPWESGRHEGSVHLVGPVVVGVDAIEFGCRRGGLVGHIGLVELLEGVSMCDGLPEFCFLPFVTGRVLHGVQIGPVFLRGDKVPVPGGQSE